MNTDRPFLPMLSSDDLIVLCSQNTLFVIDRSSWALRYTLNLESPIVSAIWMYKSMGIIRILCQNGRRTMYSLFYSSTISDYDTDMLPVSDLKLGYLRFNIQDGPYATYTLAVSADQPNHLLGVVETSDPEFQETSMHNYSNCAFARLTPSGNRLMLFYPTESQGSSLIAEKVIVKTVDVQTGELCEEVTLSLSPHILPVRGLYDPPVPTDDSHFLLNGTIYGLDGSVSALNEGSEQNDFRSAILQDRRLLYAWSGASATLSQPAEGKKYVSFSWKIDGEDTGNGSSINEKISLEIDKDDSASHFSVGRNGWMAGWGRPISTEETGLAALTGKIIVSEQMAIIAQNALNGEKVEIPYSQEDRPLAHLVLSNREAYLAFAFENGVAGFYDLQNKVSAQIPKDYATGEIREICFSDNDNYLLIMTVNGRIDCFTLAPVALAAELNECFAVSSEDLIDWVSVTEDTEDHHLILTAANESGKTDPTDLFRAKYWTSVLDTDSWEFTAQPENICGWSVEHGKALLVNGAGVGTVKTRTLKDLVEWARSELEQ